MSDDLSQFSMFELFADEAKMHAATLNEGLLAIEARPDDLGQVEALMRAAHSIKGAARIVGLDEAVQLAHAMEDCFVAVQKREEKLTSARVDQLLQGVDCFERLAGMTESDAKAWLDTNADALQTLATSLRTVVRENEKVPQGGRGLPDDENAKRGDGEATPVTSGTDGEGEETAEATPETVAAELAERQVEPSVDEPERDIDPAGSAETPEPPATRSAVAAPEVAPDRAAAEDEGDRRTVPVNARNLNRIMELAGESIVESRRMESVATALTRLRTAQRRVTAELELLSQAERDERIDATDFQQLKELCGQCEGLASQHALQLDQTAWRVQELATALHHEAVASRMRPFAEGTVAFPRMIRDLARRLNKQVTFQVVGGDVAVDRDILHKLEAPLNHLLRNCIDHGIEMPEARRASGKAETGQVVLEARHRAGMLTIEIRDDGRGVDLDALKAKVVEKRLADQAMVRSMHAAELMEFLFLPGFSTSQQVNEISGRGVGLDVVRCMVQEVSGTVRVDSRPGEGTRFTLHLPVSLSVIRAAIVEIGGEAYAFPLARLVRVLRVPVEDLQPVQGRQQFEVDGVSVGLVSGAEILGATAAPESEEVVNVVVLGEEQQWCGLVVDRFIGEQDVVVRPLDTRLGKVPHISAAAVLEGGEPLLIVDVEDLFQSVLQMLGEGRLRGMASAVEGDTLSTRLQVLVVDDSITVREVQRHLLSSHGYDVQVAVDGQDGWKALGSSQFDLLITDVDMPRMTGIELIRLVRAEPRFAELPIIIVSYKEREEDRMLGLEVGANAYLTKGSFHDDSLLTTVADLIGKPT
ncbi:MAG: response regulator [Pirellulales bacterium]